MKNLTIQELRDRGLILFEALRGSSAHGTFIEGKSDLDYVLIYIHPIENLLGLKVQEQINEDNNDTVAYELGRFCELLLKSNPSLLETIFSPEDCIIYKHPIFNRILENRNKFITKQIKGHLINYGIEQIRKSQGLNKMQNMEQEKVRRKTPLDFIYVTYKQGSRLFIEELKEKGLKQEYCGLVNVPSMSETYAVFYDYAQHLQREKIPFQEYLKLRDNTNRDFGIILSNLYISNDYKRVGLAQYNEFIEKEENFKYKGLIKNIETSNDIALSSVPKGEKPIAYLQFRKDSYSQHCKKYLQYQTWMKERNVHRFADNLAHGQNYDSKNIMNLVRLINIGYEIANGCKELIVRRPEEEVLYLLSIRGGQHDLFEIINKYEAMIPEIEEKFKHVDLPVQVDPEFVNNLLVKMRKEFYELT